MFIGKLLHNIIAVAFCFRVEILVVLMVNSI